MADLVDDVYTHWCVERSMEGTPWAKSYYGPYVTKDAAISAMGERVLMGDDSGTFRVRRCRRSKIPLQDVFEDILDLAADMSMYDLDDCWGPIDGPLFEYVDSEKAARLALKEAISEWASKHLRACVYKVGPK